MRDLCGRFLSLTVACFKGGLQSDRATPGELGASGHGVESPEVRCRAPVPDEWTRQPVLQRRENQPHILCLHFYCKEECFLNLQVTNLLNQFRSECGILPETMQQISRSFKHCGAADDNHLSPDINLCTYKPPLPVLIELPFMRRVGNTVQPFSHLYATVAFPTK